MLYFQNWNGIFKFNNRKKWAMKRLENFMLSFHCSLTSLLTSPHNCSYFLCMTRGPPTSKDVTFHTLFSPTLHHIFSFKKYILIIKAIYDNCEKFKQYRNIKNKKWNFSFISHAQVHPSPHHRYPPLEFRYLSYTLTDTGMILYPAYIKKMHVQTYRFYMCKINIALFIFHIRGKNILF